MQGQQAIILAAGRGRRLGTLTDALPKPLVPVAGTPMLVRLVRQLRARGMEHFVVVVGHHEALIRDAVQSAASGATCSFVPNPDYETTNNAYSLWLARDALARGGLLVEADVVMEDSVLDAFLAHGEEAGWGTRPFEAGMDGALLEGDENGILRRLTIVGKQEAAPFPRDMRGFHPEKALFHRHDPSPFGVFFYPHIRLIFFGADGSTNTENFIEEFRKRPVAFLVDSHRLRMFPPRVQQFWARHYVRYAEGVYVAGTMLKGDAGTKVGFEVLAPGEYKLILPAKHPKARIDIDGTTVEPGSTLSLEAGVHRIELLDPIELALFTLNLPEPPDTSTFHPFYDPIALAELDGTRRWSWVPGF